MSLLKSTFIFILVTAIIQTNAIAIDSSSSTISLQSKNFEHIEFSRIPPNHHLFHNQQLQITVNEGASFLMQAFDHVKKVKRVSFEWQSEGLPSIKNARTEEQKSGDDAVFKLGLLLKTDESILNPFIPKWMKRVDTLLNFPSEEMIYLVANAKHATGEQWANPYNKRVTMIAMDVREKQGWHYASYQFKTPVDVVGLWLMSDGDNTHSSFTARIKNIKIE